MMPFIEIVKLKTNVASVSADQLRPDCDLLLRSERGGGEKGL
jgi:hypothetical protein